MEFIKRYVPANLNIVPFGDVHIGTLLHNSSGFNKLVDFMVSPYDGVVHNVGVGMGDYVEAIDHSDKRFDVMAQDLGKIRPDMQIDHFKNRIESIKSKIAVLLDGNHEYKLIKYFPYVQRLCHDLTVPYGTYTSVISFYRKSKSGKKGNDSEQLLFKMFATHGYGTIRSAAGPPERQETNMKVRLKDKLAPLQADCAVMAMGHTHRLLIAEPISKLCVVSNNDEMEHYYTGSGQNDNYIHPDHRYYLNTGSFLKLFKRGVSGYAERFMYAPVEQGFPVVRVRDCKIEGAEKVLV